MTVPPDPALATDCDAVLARIDAALAGVKPVPLARLEGSDVRSPLTEVTIYGRPAMEHVRDALDGAVWEPGDAMRWIPGGPAREAALRQQALDELDLIRASAEADPDVLRYGLAGVSVEEGRRLDRRDAHRLQAWAGEWQRP